MEITEEKFNRLSLSIIEKTKCTPDEAIQHLESLKLIIVCGEKLRNSVPLQAALVTCVNTGKRAFLGSVKVHMPSNIICLIPWSEKKSLNDIVVELGGEVVTHIPTQGFKLMLGLEGNMDENSVQVVCNDWQAGILVEPNTSPFEELGTIPTAGIFAGAFAVGLAFLKESGIDITACDYARGISLWRPDLDWLEEKSTGPSIKMLPKKFWLLGLGHLGQAYLWNIGLLPYSLPNEITLLLQDFDKLVEANTSAGVLCEKADAKKYKTRHCAEWLEARGFATLLSERKFDEYTKRANDEPFIGLCGFDNAKSRGHLESTGFDLIVETALGSNLATFDNIILHTFPEATKSPKDIWGAVKEDNYEINHVVHEVLRKNDKEICGIVPLTIAGKSISASFVGACSGALVVAELLRGFHGGARYEKIVLQLRTIDNRKSILHKSDIYTAEMSKNGFVYAT